MNDFFDRVKCEKHGERGGGQFCLFCLREVYDRAYELQRDLRAAELKPETRKTLLRLRKALKAK